jgi:HEPN domain-containing protein
MRDERAEGERWLLQAENDLEFGRLALRERYFSQACFIAQHCAEKALKAIAYGSGERLVIGHSLVELVARLGERAPELIALGELAGLLDQYYIPTRYPNGLAGGVPYRAFAEPQAREAIEAAKRFVSIAVRELRIARV